MPPDIHIETERLALRSVAEHDLDGIVAGIDDFEVSKMLARVPHPYRRSDAESFLAACRENGGRNIALTIRDSDGVVGGLGLTGLRTDRELGYWLARPAWGKGYATEAGRAFLAHLFHVEKLDVVRSGFFHDNPASRRVQNKLGFEQIGTNMVYCLARRRYIEHVDTLLTRERYTALNA